MATAEMNIVIKTVDQSSSSIKSIESSILGLAKAVGGIYLLKQGFDFLKNSVSMASQEGKNLKTLQTLIENNGESWEKSEKQLTAYIKKVEYNSMFTDEQIIPGLRQLASFGMEVAQSQMVMSSAMDLATAKGLDLSTAVNLIGKAYNGNTDSLKRYGITATDFNDLMGQINKKFGGSAQKDMDTYAGSVKRLETSWQEFQKTLGTGLIPTTNKLVLALDTLLGGGKTPEPTGALKELTDINQVKQTYIDILKGEKILNREIGDGTLIAINGVKVSMAIMNDKTAMAKEIIRLTDEEKKAVIKLGEEQKDQGEKNKSIKKEETQNNTELLDSEIWLRSQIIEANKVFRSNEIEAEKKKSDEIASMMMNASNMAIAVGVASNNAFLQGVGVVIKGVETTVSAITAILEASTFWGIISGIFRLVAGVVNTATALRNIDDLQRQNERILTTSIANTTGTSIAISGTSTSGSNMPTPTSVPASIERATAPIYYNISNSYNINSGVILGDEFSIDSAFKRLMERYDNNKNLTLSGA